VRYTLTQHWDRSPEALTVSLYTAQYPLFLTLVQFSKAGNFIYFTAGDEAKVKVFVLPIPPTPRQSTTDPVLSSKYSLPVALTSGKAASGIQTLFTGGLLFTQSSLTSPNDVFIIRGLQYYEADIMNVNNRLPFRGQVEQISRFTEDELKGKDLSEGEEFWFKGANEKDIHGWALKPKGWKANETKKYPVLLLIHGGSFQASSRLSVSH
jgi:dipeptidyl aminopeptidase/acylaminoacyl peptidase